MDVSVCIVDWAGADQLRRCLRSIARQTTGVRYEVIVVGNGATDDDVASVEIEFASVRVVASTEPLSFARGSNLAAESAVGELLLYLSPSAELASDALTGMSRYLADHPDCGAVGCRLLHSDGSIRMSCAAAFPSARNELASMLLLNRLFPRSPALASRDLTHWDHADSRDVDCLSGACMMLRRTLERRLGGFDEGMFTGGEDLDLCRRIQREGLALHYLASETIYQHEELPARLRGDEAEPLQAGNYYFLQKNYGSAKAWSYRCAVSIGSLLRLLTGLLASPLWVLWNGLRNQAPWKFVAHNANLFLWSVGLRGRPTR